MINGHTDPSTIAIDGIDIRRGERTQINIPVGRIPSGTRVFVSAHVYRANTPGPVLLLLAGIHGDEINGIETVRRFLQSSLLNQLERGTLIVIPLLNVFGFINFSRDVPDGKDVNRSFPGVSSGSLASRVASAITKKILPHVHFAIDMHTGGASRYNHPQIRFSSKYEGNFEMARAFGAPLLIQKNAVSRSFRKIANEAGICAIVYEAGEAIRLDGFSIEVGGNGIENILNYLGMTNSGHIVKRQQILFKASSWIRASDAGIFVWSKSSGQTVIKGEPLGEIHSPQGDRQRVVIARRDGHIIGHNNSSVVQNGDALFHIGMEPEILV